MPSPSTARGVFLAVMKATKGQRTAASKLLLAANSQSPSQSNDQSEGKESGSNGNNL